MISIYIVFNVIVVAEKLVKFNDVCFTICISKNFNFSNMYVMIVLIAPCISLYIINVFICMFVLDMNVCIWNIIISELNDSIKDVIHKIVVTFNGVQDKIFIPFVNSNIPIIIPLIVLFAFKIANSMLGISENIMVYPKMILKVLNALSIDEVNILP